MNNKKLQIKRRLGQQTSKVNFFNSPKILKDRKILKQYLIKLLSKERKEVESINIIFCTDNELLEINKRFLNHNFYTDIITFDLSTSSSDALFTELYISIDRIRENAKNHNSTIKKELHRVIFHGLLHLCGYGDKSEKQASLMRLKEDEYLKAYKI